MLKIVSRVTEDLDVRRFRVLIKFNEQLPYTITKLKEQIANLCGEDGYSAAVDSVNYKLVVKVALKSKAMLSEVGTMLERIVPLNVIIDLDLLYNQHQTLHRFTHAELHTYTHKALKDEVIN
jgi:phosphoribosyl-dephospho-CoA transferase